MARMVAAGAISHTQAVEVLTTTGLRVQQTEREIRDAIKGGFTAEGVPALNVLPDPWQRIRALQHAARFACPGGHLFVVTRAPADIDPRAGWANWPAHHDGYWSSQAKGTFQKGISTEEIVALGRRAGLRPAADQVLLAGSPAAGQALLVKPP